MSPGHFDDWVDVYEDRLWGWHLKHAESLKSAGPDAWVAILHLATAFIEPYEIFRSGSSSDGRSREFFVCGFRRIFQGSSPPLNADVLDRFAEELYKQLRCGLFHAGFPRGKVALANAGDAITVAMDPATGNLVQFVINPHSFLGTIVREFRWYVSKLRDSSDPQHAALRANFEAGWHLVHRN